MTAPVRITKAEFDAYTVAQAADFLGIHRATLSVWLAKQTRDDLWVESPGGRKRFTQEHIENLREAYYRNRNGAPRDARAAAEFAKARERLQRPEKPNAGYCYVAVCRSSGFVKLGFSNDPERRVSDLRSKTGLSLDLIAIFDGGLNKERALHKRFAEYRREGEWFAFDGRLRRFIEGLPR